MRSLVEGALVVAAALAVSACSTVGPDHRRPEFEAPAAFQNAGPWKAAAPADLIARGDWWQVFQDPVLNDLQARAKQRSPTLAAYAARVDQARAIAGIAGSFQFPEVAIGAVAGRYRASENRPDQPEKRAGNRAYESSVYRVPLTVGYELDLWGRVRRQTEAARARADASRAEYQTVALTLESEIATQYIRLRQTGEERRLLDRNIVLQRRARDLVVARRNGGLASELDVARIEAELSLTESAAEDARRRHDDLELALSTLVGEMPEGFRIPDAPFVAVQPAIPVGLPAELLERRPDVAEAERTLAARNAEIGVSKAAYFPAIRLTGAFGFESDELSQFLNQDSLIWSLGASLFQPVFNAGRIGFDVDRAKAAHAEAVAHYRGRLLRAFREVESALASLRALEEQSRLQTRAREHAGKAVHLAEARYRAGLVVVLEVIDAQRAQLRADREALAVQGNQLVTTISLVKALGGGWSARPVVVTRISAARPSP